jgi:glycosyltransferase involved in cell wall biosynthesis
MTSLERDLPAVSLVVPTRNRAYTLRLVASSWYDQAGVDEIIFVDDAGDDDTPALTESFAAAYPGVRTILVRNPARAGASESRNRGIARATNEFVLFCDDDQYLGPGYAQTCLRKLLERDAGAVSGRDVFLLPAETMDEALKRFGTGTKAEKMYRALTCWTVHEAKFSGDIELPLTNPVILTRLSLLKRFGFDSFYARGNGYREETDYQMNLFVHDFPIIVTNDCHTFHLNSAQVRTGGARGSRWSMIYWPMYYTNYFYGKYWSRYAPRVGLRTSRYPALAAFAVFYMYTTFLKNRLARFALGRALVGIATQIQTRKNA